MIGRGGPSLDEARGRQPRIVARRKKRMRPGAFTDDVCVFLVCLRAIVVVLINR